MSPYYHYPSNQSPNTFPDYCWSYDSFGNRTMQMNSSSAFPAGSGGPSPCQTSGSIGQTFWAQFNGTVNGTSNNQMSGNSQNPNQGSYYDDAGNITFDGNNSYLYDADGRICAVSNSSYGVGTVMTGYLYDAEGMRVAKGSVQNMTSCDPAVNGFQATAAYVLGPSGEQITEVQMDSNGSMAWEHTNVWAGGNLLATYDWDGLHFYFDDPLGTRRVQTDFAGVVEQTCSSLPFGDGESCLPTPTEHLFTNHVRDAESGNDYFGARYYASTMGRFMSPDWSAKVEPVPYAKLDDPQSLNLYAYVLNNPLTHFDPDGHWCFLGGIGTSCNKIPPPPTPAPPAQQQNTVTASAKGSSVTYTYPDGSKVVLTGTHPFRDNNPGDLRSGHGSIGRDGGFAIYSSLDAGVSALGATLTGKYGDSTIADTMKSFAPGSDGNDPVKYANTLASAVGVPVTTKISALSSAQLMTFQYNIAIAEGYNAAGNTARYIAPQQ